jgi:hypothetical protein
MNYKISVKKIIFKNKNLKKFLKLFFIYFKLEKNKIVIKFNIKI